MSEETNTIRKGLEALKDNLDQLIILGRMPANCKGARLYPDTIAALDRLEAREAKQKSIKGLTASLDPCNVGRIEAVDGSTIRLILPDGTIELWNFSEGTWSKKANKEHNHA